MNPRENMINEELDQAVSARLRRLSSMPVDLSRLEQRVRRAIPQRRQLVMRMIRPLGAVAASVTVLAVIAAALLTASSGEVLASPAQMAQVHREIVANPLHVMKVGSIDEASRALTEQWRGIPDLPQAPETHVMACCMKSIKDKKLACVLLNSQGTPITMSVGKASDMRLPAGPTVTRGGITYHVQSWGSLNMVTTEQAGRWVCLIAELPQDKLIDLAARLRF